MWYVGVAFLRLCRGKTTVTFRTMSLDVHGISTNLGNVELNWPKLFQAFSVKFTLLFCHEYVHSIIPHQHM